MSKSDNKVELTGFAGSDAELKEIGNNKKLAKVSIAVNDNYRNFAGEEVKNTQWFNLVFWGAKADDAVRLIKKGTLFSVEGRLSTQQYEAKDGTKRYTTDIVVNEIELVKTTAEVES